MSDKAATMDLREFIATSLTQIQQGVQDAIDQRSTPSAKGAINPVWGIRLMTYSKST